VPIGFSLFARLYYYPNNRHNRPPAGEIHAGRPRERERRIAENHAGRRCTHLEAAPAARCPGCHRQLVPSHAPAPVAPTMPTPREALEHLDARHDELIRRLDELNAQIEAALVEFSARSADAEPQAELRKAA
jgi:hypothetical protein